MTIVEGQLVEVKWNNANRKHYENKGYKFTKNGDVFTVKVEDLTKGSKSIVKISCDQCDEIFDREFHQLSRHNNHFCSNRCQHDYRSKQALSYMITKICEQCGEEYKVENSRKDTARFCSQKCVHEWRSINTRGNKSPNYVPRYIIKCDWCGEEIYRTKNKIEHNNNNFCSKSCQKSWFTNIYSQTDDFKNRSKKTILKNINEGKIKQTDTLPHKIINNLLDKLNINYKNEEIKYGYAVDIYLVNYDLFIEINGEFWHCDSRKYKSIEYDIQLKRIIEDKKKNTRFKNNGYNILYLWENDIINNIDLCEKLIKTFIKSQSKMKYFHSMNYKLDDDKLIEIKDNIPYSRMNYNKIKQLVSTDKREKVTSYDASKHVKFKCDNCSKESEMLKIRYDKCKSHFCSNKCRREKMERKFKHTCDNCGKDIYLNKHRHEYIVSGKQQNLFCNKKCKNEYQKRNHKEHNRTGIIKKCEYCNNEYYVNNYRKDSSKYCSDKCRQLGLRHKIKLKCAVCNNIIYKTKSQLTKNKTGLHFCSHKCHNEYLRLNKKKIVKTCAYINCENKFELRDSKSTKRFCSIQCANKQKGIDKRNKYNHI